MVELLISDSGLRNALIENARNRIEEHHSCKAERGMYFKLVKELIGDSDDNGLTSDSSKEKNASESTGIIKKAGMF